MQLKWEIGKLRLRDFSETDTFGNNVLSLLSGEFSTRVLVHKVHFAPRMVGFAVAVRSSVGKRPGSDFNEREYLTDNRT
jgi:hypothetical protein